MHMPVLAPAIILGGDLKPIRAILGLILELGKDSDGFVIRHRRPEHSSIEFRDRVFPGECPVSCLDTRMLPKFA